MKPIAGTQRGPSREPFVPRMGGGASTTSRVRAADRPVSEGAHIAFCSRAAGSVMHRHYVAVRYGGGDIGPPGACPESAATARQASSRDVAPTSAKVQSVVRAQR